MPNQERIKVLRVVTSSECVPWHLANTLKRISKDFDVCVIGDAVSQYRHAYPEIEWENITLTRKINLFADLHALISLCRLIRRHRPQILHSIMPKAGLVSAIAGFVCRVPVRMHTFTGQVWATEAGIKRALLQTLDKLVVRLNTLCLTDSFSQSEFLYQHGISMQGEPLSVLSKGSLSGVDISRFHRPEIITEAEALRKKLYIADTDFVFTFIARKSLDKGAIDILHAFTGVVQNYPYAKLLFIGPDESYGQVDKVITSDPLLLGNVRNVDRVDNHEVYLALSDVLCLPSYREGFGSIVIDAAAMGVPAIGSNISGLVDAIENDSTGKLFPVGNIEALKQIMCSMVKEPSRVEVMGKLAKERVLAYYTADILYEALKNLYLKQVHDH